jgi:hypothetical protein
VKSRWGRYVESDLTEIMTTASIERLEYVWKGTTQPSSPECRGQLTASVHLVLLDEAVVGCFATPLVCGTLIALRAAACGCGPALDGNARTQFARLDAMARLALEVVRHRCSRQRQLGSAPGFGVALLNAAAAARATGVRWCNRGCSRQAELELGGKYVR